MVANEGEALPKRVELRRDVSVWGSFMWGYADVGANTFLALGLVMAAAQGATGLAFTLAGSVYILIGLAYTELASAYPVAGGGPYFTLRGLGDFWGFTGTAALLLAYTINIALFATAAAGYFNFFLPYFFGIDIDRFAIDLGPFQGVNPVWCLETLALIGLLMWLNILGVKESSRLNEVLGIIIIMAESALVILGFLLAWRGEFLVYQWKTEFPSFDQFTYGASLAIISFIGLESIAQAAQETRRPASIIPRTSVALTFSVFIFATSFSLLGLGLLPWQVYAEHVDNPMAKLAEAIPYIGAIAGPFTAALGAIVLFISSNTGIMGSSRLTYSMAQYHVVSEWFSAVHPRYRTPVRAIVIFTVISLIQTILSFLTPKVMLTLGDMYAFGAALGYTLVFIALIKLRFSDPYTPRPYKMPLNITITYKGRKVEFPVLGLVGLLGVSAILIEVARTHPIGRIAGPAWILLCLFYYAWYRKKKGLPIFGSLKREWEREQVAILTAAEEHDLLEQYKIALMEREREAKRQVKI